MMPSSNAPSSAKAHTNVAQQDCEVRKFRPTQSFPFPSPQAPEKFSQTPVNRRTLVGKRPKTARVCGNLSIAREDCLHREEVYDVQGQAVPVYRWRLTKGLTAIDEQISDGERNHAHVHFVEYPDVRRTPDVTRSSRQARASEHGDLEPRL